jgi:hypothetical protein
MAERPRAVIPPRRPGRGIYILDGGQTASALGNILGNIATNLGPQAQAEAQNLRYRTEGQDISRYC